MELRGEIDLVCCAPSPSPWETNVSGGKTANIKKQTPVKTAEHSGTFKGLEPGGSRRLITAFVIFCSANARRHTFKGIIIILPLLERGLAFIVLKLST